jgi:RNA polymerase sigma-70 factor, ECF subfamily
LERKLLKYKTIEILVRHKKSAQMSEKQLIEACRNNKRKAQKQLYDKYCDAMFTIAYRVVGDHDLAKDVLQETFISVFKDIKQFRGESTIGAWIKTITIRCAIRKLKKEEIFVGMDQNTQHEPISWPDEMLGEDLEKAILSLPSGYRAVFLLIEVEGYKHKEVAEMLSISEGTSKSQLFFAKKQLQKKLVDFTDR